MNKPRLANLLDDFALGGVSKNLGVFDTDPVRAVVDPVTMPIRPDAMIAPRIDAEIIVTHFPPNWGRLAFLASLKQRNPQARIIHVEHSYCREWERLKVSNTVRFRAMLGIAMRLVDHVVCVSQAQAEWLAQAARLPRGRIEVLYPYSDHSGLSALMLPDFAAFPVRRIGAYGRFHEAKGFDLLIAAWKAGAMPDSELLIGGLGPEEAQLRALAGDMPGIRFVGRVNDVAEFLGQCDLVAVPSRWEPYGLVATEAREAGRPILVSPADGLPEQVGDAGLVVDFADRRAVATAFASLDPARLGAMASAGRDATANWGFTRQLQWARMLEGAAHRDPSHRRLPLPA